MQQIYNFEDCKTNNRNGTYGGQAGDKEGVVWNGENWIIKYPKSTRGMRGDLISYMTSPLSEYIGSHIYAILGYDVHDTKLGIRDNTLVVACKDFCENKGDLMEIRTLKNVHNRILAEVLERSFSSTSSDHLVDLQSLLIHFKHNPIFCEVPDIQKRFWDCVVVDVLINNNDRNNGNWGILSSGEGYKLAPIFDNGAAFYNKSSENKISSTLNDSERMKMSALETRTVYGTNDKVLSSKDVLRVNNLELKMALQKNVPLIRSKMPDIRKFIQEIPEEYQGIPVCSAVRKEFYIKGMDLRLEYLLEPALERQLAYVQGAVPEL